jgi:precorrin-6A/cobalt-precorrin-6A reductase
VKILVLGGTSESRALAGLLEIEPEFDAVSSLAGRVREPVLPVGASRVGGFGGSIGLATWIRDNGVDVLVDATHPFASAMSSNAVAAASATGIALARLERPPWRRAPADNWIEAGSVDEASKIVESTAQRAFLTVGRQSVGRFARVEHTWFLVRCIDPPEGPLPPHHELVLARGPFGVEEEIRSMSRYGIDTLVTKNSGGTMTEAKLVAARALGTTVVMIARPARQAADFVADSPAAVVGWLRSRL